MMRLSDRFRIIHEAGALQRAIGGLATELPGAAPSALGWRFRHWQRAELEIVELRRIAKPLRLRYAIDHDWQPGLWKVEDIDGRHRPPAKLRLGRN